MSTITKKKILQPDTGPFGGAPYGNKTTFRFNLTLNSSGVLVASDDATAVVIDDIIRFGVLPKGFQIHDAKIIISTAAGQVATADIGFAYVDGVDSADVPQDADYFTATLALNAPIRKAMDNLAVTPIRLEKDAYVVMLVEAFNITSAMVVDIIIDGIAEGKL